MECADRTGARTSRLGNERGSIFRPLPLASQKSGPEAGSVSATAQGQERGIGRARRRIDRVQFLDAIFLETTLVGHLELGDTVILPHVPLIAGLPDLDPD